MANQRSPFWTENLDMTARGEAIVDEVMSERMVVVCGATYLISRFCGENILVPDVPEAIEIWRWEIVEEATRRMAALEMKEANTDAPKRFTAEP